MRKFLLLLSVLFLSAGVKAQSESKHDVALTVGVPSGAQVVIGTWMSVFDNIGDNADDETYAGCWSLQYYYHFKPWLDLGGKVIWEGTYHEIKSGTGTPGQIGRGRHYWLSGLASVRFNYVNRENLRLYSGLDFGIASLTDVDHYYKGHTDSEGRNHVRDTGIAPGFGITPLGVSFGRSVYGLVETNFGFDSFLKVGIGYRF